MITCKFVGRLGNQLFQYAFLLGLAKKHGVEVRLPPWKYSRYFGQEYPQGILGGKIVREPHFHYCEFDLDWSKDWEFYGYFQSWKYIKTKLQFRNEFIEYLGKSFNFKDSIAIHLRRGDYVGNPNYVNLSIGYYMGALEKYFPEWRKMTLFVFSDDTDYANTHFGSLPNVKIIYNNEIESLCLMSQCENFILANSTFGWWGAYLSGSKNVVRPDQYFEGNMHHTHSLKDHYPPEWKVFDHRRKVDLRDCTFMIPVKRDSVDREVNTHIAVGSIKRYFDTNFIIGEQGSNTFSHYEGYIKFDYPEFHRTRMLNEMTKAATTPIVVNLDADVVMPPMRILEAVEMIRNGVHVVYPYDGRFVRIARTEWIDEMKDNFDIGAGGKTICDEMRFDRQSKGGAIFFNKDAYIKGGGENEKFVSFGPEDAERFERFTKLGFDVRRLSGPIYHLEHYRGADSSTGNPRIEANRAEWHKVRKMRAKELKKYVTTWKTFP